MDKSTTVQELKRLVADFRDARGWRKYDSPRNLAVSVSIEAAELLEHFQWKTDREVDEIVTDRAKVAHISEELADVVIYCLGLADTLAVDVSKAVREKLTKNAEKYPARLPSTAGNV